MSNSFLPGVQPVIIIGAPRSGTNMLRDVICKLDGVETWPCDEINYIWRHGNVRFPSDAMPVELARPEVVSYIQRQFVNFSQSQPMDYLIEKTCANSLRVPFVDVSVPNAKYIYIVRNGYDVVSSAMKRWQASLDIPYIMKKVKYVPKGDLPYYALRYLGHRIHKLLSKENRLASWGPVLDNQDKILSELGSLEEVCALQWNECVRLSDLAFAEMESPKVHYIKYEDFVATPQEELAKVGSFLGFNHSDAEYQQAVSEVRVSSVGKGRKEISGNLLHKISPIVLETIKKHGYES